MKRIAIFMMVTMLLLSSCAPLSGSKEKSDGTTKKEETSEKAENSKNKAADPQQKKDKKESDEITINSDTDKKDEEASTPEAELPDSSYRKYFEAFIVMCGKTIEEVNGLVGEDAELSNPDISKVSYVWKLAEDFEINATTDGDGVIQGGDIKASDEAFYNPEVKFAEDLASLKGMDNLKYQDVKEKCGVDGIPNMISARTGTLIVTNWVWVSEDYYFSASVRTDGRIGSFVGRPVSRIWSNSGSKSVSPL